MARAAGDPASDGGRLLTCDGVSDLIRGQSSLFLRLTPQASAAEEAAYRALLAIRFTQGSVHRGGKQQELQRVAMQKAVFSSPSAALESTQKRIHLLTRERQPTADE